MQRREPWVVFHCGMRYSRASVHNGTGDEHVCVSGKNQGRQRERSKPEYLPIRRPSSRALRCSGVIQYQSSGDKHAAIETARRQLLRAQPAGWHYPAVYADYFQQPRRFQGSPRSGEPRLPDQQQAHSIGALRL